MEMRDTFADVDTLGPPTGYPDDSGTQAWVSYSKYALPGLDAKFPAHICAADLGFVVECKNPA